MKRALTTLASFILAIPLCVSAFAAAPYSARAGICPRCDKPSLHSRAVGTERGVLDPRPCIHYRYGEDYIVAIYRVYTEECGSCSYENTYKIKVSEDVTFHGYQ